MIKDNLALWTDAIARQPWGIQQAIKTSLELTASEDIKMCHGADDHNGAPCLINSINAMLSHNADVSPSARYPDVVMTFDTVNRDMFKNGVNVDDNLVSPLCADVLLANMGELKPVPALQGDVDMLTPEQFQEWARGRRSSESQSQAFENIVDELLER